MLKPGPLLIDQRPPVFELGFKYIYFYLRAFYLNILETFTSVFTYYKIKWSIRWFLKKFLLVAANGVWFLHQISSFRSLSQFGYHLKMPFSSLNKLYGLYEYLNLKISYFILLITTFDAIFPRIVFLQDWSCCTQFYSTFNWR